MKPANIKIRPDGSGKVLDFGLAKSGDAQEVTADSPTMMPGTLAGMILGTAGYMSPEQARGQAVDKRADIWAFGVVFHEMLTAKRLFDGATVTDSLAAILTREPDFTLAPERTRRLLARCLEKDPKKRLRDIGDACALLDTESATAAPSRSRFGMTGWIAAAALFAVSTATLSFVHFREKAPVARVVNATLLPPGDAEFDFGIPFALPALSPDGTRIAFGARTKDGRRQLYVRRLDSPTAQTLPGTEGAAFPFWSPDSRWVGFGQGGKLKKIDTQGGPPVTVYRCAGGRVSRWQLEPSWRYHFRHEYRKQYPARGGSGWKGGARHARRTSCGIGWRGQPLVSLVPAGWTPLSLHNPANRRHPGSGGHAR